MMRLDEFFAQVVTRARLQHERLGQAASNILMDVYPPLWEHVRRSQRDPFYFEAGSARYRRFVEFITERWEWSPQALNDEFYDNAYEDRPIAEWPT